jgi:hypothetical protein
MIEYFQVMTFQQNAMPMPLENSKHSTRQEALNRMEELKQIYNCPMYVSHIYHKNN